MSTVAKSTKFYSGFDPRTIGACALWMDAADPRTITLSSGTNISTWLDKSGRGCNATAVNNPTYSNTRVNFVRTSNQFFTLPNSTLPTGSSSYAYFIVCSYDADVLGGLIGGGTYGTARAVTAIRKGDGARSIRTYWWSDDFQTGTNVFTLNSNTIVESLFNSNATTLQRTMLINGLQVASNTPGGVRNQTISNNTIGTTNTTEYMSGSISEIIVYSNAMRLEQRQAVEAYLGWKWGIQTSLTAGHPYRALGTFTRGFQPIDISGLVTWMDGADPTTMTIVGTNITEWRDKSPTGLVFSNQIATQAVYNSNLINGLPGVDLTNGSGFISTTTFVKTLSLSWAGVVVVKSGISTWGSIFVHGGRDNDFAVERNGSTARLHFQTANDNVGCDISYNIDQVDLYLGTMTNGTSRFFERIGGGTDASGTATNALTMTTTAANIRIGRSDATAPPEPFNSFIGEIVYYNRVLTDVERQHLESYLTNRWQITGLRSSNVFFNRRFLPSTSIFFPPNISNCTLWIDASDPTTVTLSGSNVTGINDKSATGYNLTRSFTAGFEITYANRLNGLPTLLFPNDPVDNNNTRTFLTSATNFTINTSLHACFFVMRFNPYVLEGTTTARSWGQIFPFNMNAANGFQCGLNRTGPNWRLAYGLQGVGISASNTTSVSSSSLGPAAPGLPVIGAIVRTANNTYLISYNGTLQTITGSTTLAAATATVRVGIYFQNQELCELLFYNGFAMRLEDIRRVEGYLAWKWGLQTTLPTTHPYYEFRP